VLNSQVTETGVGDRPFRALDYTGVIVTLK